MTESDLELLSAFESAGHADAFAELVARHEGWLFAAARRRLRDDHLADDARQAVFLLLSEKAQTLVQAKSPSISGWLFHVMHFTCSGILRARSRRDRHESAVGRLFEPMASSGPDDGALMLLEDTISQLSPRDREAVVRRFYQGESFATVGQALGVTAEAARKRVTRALAMCRAAMSLDGVDALPATLLEHQAAGTALPRRTPGSPSALQKIEALAKGTMAMIEQSEAIKFTVMSAEFFVRRVEDNLDFFERLGFRRHFVEAADAAGHVPRASLRGGDARIWLRRATGQNQPAPGVAIYFWLDGGEAAVIRHRDAIAAQGVAVNQYFYDTGLVNFTVTTPDGYTIGFFSTYKPHVHDPESGG